METNSDIPTGDIFDSRDVIKRITELELGEDSLDEYEQEELKGLKELEDEAKGVAPDWEHGATFICDDYFEDYARDLAEDIGAISRDSHWPANCIDWEQAANELRMDYCSIEVDGTDYWVR